MNLSANIPEEIKTNIRSVLLSKAGGVKIERFLRDYTHLVQEKLMYRKYGFKTMEDLLHAIPDVCRIKESEEGVSTVYGVVDNPDLLLTHTARKAQFLDRGGSREKEVTRLTVGFGQAEKDKKPCTYDSSDRWHDELQPNLNGYYCLCFPRPVPFNRQAIHDEFGTYGKIAEIGVTKKFVFVRFLKKQSALDAMMEKLNKYDLRIPTERTLSSDVVKVNDTGRHIGRPKSNKIEVYFGNLAPCLSEDDLNALLFDYNVKQIRINRQDHDREWQYAFVEVANKEDGQKVISFFHNKILRGRPVIAQFAFRDQDKQNTEKQQSFVADLLTKSKPISKKSQHQGGKSQVKSNSAQDNKEEVWDFDSDLTNTKPRPSDNKQRGGGRIVKNAKSNPTVTDEDDFWDNDYDVTKTEPRTPVNEQQQLNSYNHQNLVHGSASKEPFTIKNTIETTINVTHDTYEKKSKLDAEYQKRKPDVHQIEIKKEILDESREDVEKSRTPFKDRMLSNGYSQHISDVKVTADIDNKFALNHKETVTNESNDHLLCSGDAEKHIDVKVLTEEDDKYEGQRKKKTTLEKETIQENPPCSKEPKTQISTMGLEKRIEEKVSSTHFSLNSPLQAAQRFTEPQQYELEPAGPSPLKPAGPPPLEPAGPPPLEPAGPPSLVPAGPPPLEPAGPPPLEPAGPPPLEPAGPPPLEPVGPPPLEPTGPPPLEPALTGPPPWSFVNNDFIAQNRPNFSQNQPYNTVGAGQRQLRPRGPQFMNTAPRPQQQRFPPHMQQQQQQRFQTANDQPRFPPPHQQQLHNPQQQRYQLQQQHQNMQQQRNKSPQSLQQHVMLPPHQQHATHISQQHQGNRTVPSQNQESPGGAFEARYNAASSTSSKSNVNAAHQKYQGHVDMSNVQERRKIPLLPTPPMEMRIPNPNQVRPRNMNRFPQSHPQRHPVRPRMEDFRPRGRGAFQGQTMPHPRYPGQRRFQGAAYGDTHDHQGRYMHQKDRGQSQFFMDRGDYAWEEEEYPQEMYDEEYFLHDMYAEESYEEELEENPTLQITGFDKKLKRRLKGLIYGYKALTVGLSHIWDGENHKVTCAYATFNDRDEAMAAMFALNGLEFYGGTLQVQLNAVTEDASITDDIDEAVKKFGDIQIKVSTDESKKGNAESKRDVSVTSQGEYDVTKVENKSPVPRKEKSPGAQKQQSPKDQDKNKGKKQEGRNRYDSTQSWETASEASSHTDLHTPVDAQLSLTESAQSTKTEPNQSTASKKMLEKRSDTDQIHEPDTNNTNNSAAGVSNNKRESVDNQSAIFSNVDNSYGNTVSNRKNEGSAQNILMQNAVVTSSDIEIKAKTEIISSEELIAVSNAGSLKEVNCANGLGQTVNQDHTENSPTKDKSNEKEPTSDFLDARSQETNANDQPISAENRTVNQDEQEVSTLDKDNDEISPLSQNDEKSKEVDMEDEFDRLLKEEFGACDALKLSPPKKQTVPIAASQKTDNCSNLPPESISMEEQAQETHVKSSTTTDDDPSQQSVQDQATTAISADSAYLKQIQALLKGETGDDENDSAQEMPVMGEEALPSCMSSENLQCFSRDCFPHLLTNQHTAHLPDTLKVVVRDVLSPQYFWAQYIDEGGALTRVLTNMTEVAVLESEGKLAEYATDKRRAACISHGEWSRVWVESIEGESARVFYVDWGNADQVPVTSLRLIPEEMWHDGPCILPCRLVEALEAPLDVDSALLLQRIGASTILPMQALDVKVLERGIEI